MGLLALQGCAFDGNDDPAPAPAEMPKNVIFFLGDGYGIVPIAAQPGLDASRAVV